MPEQFSRRQAELILRRTAELERRTDPSLDAISAEDLAGVASELGLSEDALRQALAEARAGLLQPGERPGFLDRTFGGRVIEARRFVPGDLAGVRAGVERFLQEQGFVLKRDRGDVTTWEPARDLWSKLRRAFRGGPYRLPRDVEIDVRIAEVPGGPHPVLVGLRVDATRLRSASVSGSGAALVVGAAGAVAGVALLPAPVELLACAGGALVGVGGALGGRASYRTVRERLQVAIERFLDFLEREPLRSSSPDSRDPISRLVDFLSRGDWWR